MCLIDLEVFYPIYVILIFTHIGFSSKFCLVAQNVASIKDADHKPLEMITRISIHKASSRIQAMLLRLIKYNHNVNYQPGPTMYIADTLSRAYMDREHESDDIQVDTNMRIHRLVTRTYQCPTSES